MSNVHSFGQKQGPSKAERISRIESIVKRAKAPSTNKTSKKKLTGTVASENALILFEAINPKRHGETAKKSLNVF